MLREIRAVRQNPGEHRRRWFQGEHMDLFVWTSPAQAISRFQLSLEEHGVEHAITWDAARGYALDRVDSDDLHGRHPASPILREDDSTDVPRMLAAFELGCGAIEPSIADFVIARLAAYPGAARVEQSLLAAPGARPGDDRASAGTLSVVAILLAIMLGCGAVLVIIMKYAA